MHAQPVLQFLEIAAPIFVKGNDLSIHDRICNPKLRRQILKFWILSGDVPPRTCPQSRPPVLDLGDGANAIPFNFKYPIGIGKRLLFQFRQCGVNSRRHVRHPCFHRAAEFRRIDDAALARSWSPFGDIL